MKYLKFKKFVKEFRRLRGQKRMDLFYSLTPEVKDLIKALSAKRRDYVSYELHPEEERN